MEILNFNDFLNEKRVVIKRKYTENYPAKKLSTHAKVRNQVFKVLQNGMLSEEEFSNLLTTTNAHNRWFKRNSRFFVVKEESGIKKIGLSSYGQKVMTKTLNESKSFNEFINEGVWSNIMKGVRPSQSPWSIVAIEYNKVVGQSIDIKIPDLVPAKYEALKREYPKARIHIEDAGGQVVWTEKK
jgi:hypothetical protein